MRVVLTSRPQATRDALQNQLSAGPSSGSAASSLSNTAPLVRDMFKAWEPVSIEPSSAENLTDLELVIKAKLTSGDLVRQQDVEAAVKLLRQKSRGQFVWVKFAADQLLRHEGPWSLDELRVGLVDGLYGTYRFLLGSVKRALQAEQPALWQAIHGKLLPVLLAAREGLAPAQLAWLAGVPEATVTESMELLENLFPCAAGGKDVQPRILPYHKSVLDWLGSQEEAGVDLYADRMEGERLAAAACLAEASKMELISDKEPGGDKEEFKQAGGLLASYAQRHAVSHAVAAGDAATLEALVQQLGFWQHVHGAGKSVCFVSAHFQAFGLPRAWQRCKGLRSEIWAKGQLFRSQLAQTVRTGH